jgi:hypothetical protein
MSTIPAKRFERSRDNPDGRNHACARPTTHSYHDEAYRLFVGGGT